MSSQNIQQKTKIKNSQPLIVILAKNLSLQNSYFKNTYIQGKCNLDKNFQCDICKKWVKTKDSLDQHMSKYHYDPSVLLDCPYQNCDQKCGNKQSLKRHIDWHKDIQKKEKERQKFLEEQK